MKVMRMWPAEGDSGEPRNHAFEQGGNDYTLCGYTLDGDELVVKDNKIIEGQITCEQCWAIIEYCRTIKQRKIGEEP